MIKYLGASLRARREALSKDEQSGFTLIELLVVILIIGVLAAIAVPVFIGQVQQAQDSAAQQQLSTAKLAYVAYLVEEPAGLAAGDLTAGVPTGPAADRLAELGWPTGEPIVTVSTVGGQSAFELSATSENAAKVFVITGSTGPTPE